VETGSAGGHGSGREDRGGEAAIGQEGGQKPTSEASSVRPELRPGV